MSAQEVLLQLKQKGTKQRAQASAWFFKTAPGQYGYGDRFFGVTVPEQRKLAKQFKALPFAEVKRLMQSAWHEARLVAVFILVYQFQRGDVKQRKQIYDFYLKHTQYINNWDIVDSSAGYIVGEYLQGKPITILRKLAKSKRLWDRRIAIIATFAFTMHGNPLPTLEIAAMLLNDKEDLMHKAVGWMLREVGKRCSADLLRGFLRQHAATMPRTALRYSIEHFSKAERQRWLQYGK